MSERAGYYSEYICPHCGRPIGLLSEKIAQLQKCLDDPTIEMCIRDSPYWLETQKRWKCRQCRKQFSVKVNTIFEDSPIPLQKWLPALWLLISCKNGVSSWEIHRAMGVSQKTAWFMLHRLRLGLKTDAAGTKLGGTESGGVEAVSYTHLDVYKRQGLI